MHQYFYQHLTEVPRSGLVDTAWWQVILALIVAVATALSAHYFYERRGKRSRTVSAAAQLIASSRQLRRNFLGFAEYETDFNRQEMAYYQAARITFNTTAPIEGDLDNEQKADTAKAAATEAKSQAQAYQKQILTTQGEIDKAYFLLMGLNSTVRENKKLKKALEALLDFRLVTVSSDMDLPRENIENVFKPNLGIIQKECGELMVANTKSWLSKYVQWSS